MTLHLRLFGVGASLAFAGAAFAEPPPISPSPSSASSAALVQLKSCPIKAVEVFRRARASGYRFVGERAKGEGECFVDENFPTFIGRAGDVALECHFRGFAGMAMKSRWRVTGASFTGDPFILTMPTIDPAPSGAAPLEFALQVPAKSDRKVVLSSVVMSGTDCAQWQEAF